MNLQNLNFSLSLLIIEIDIFRIDLFYYYYYYYYLGNLFGNRAYHRQQQVVLLEIICQQWVEAWRVRHRPIVDRLILIIQR